METLQPVYDSEGGFTGTPFTITRKTQTRIRVNHTSTVKEGFRVGEITVEFTCDGLPTPDDFDALNSVHAQAYGWAVMQAHAMNGTTASAAS